LNNTAFSVIAPYTTPSATAGSQTNYVIESAVAIVSFTLVNYSDLSSQFVIKTGGVFMLSSLDHHLGHHFNFMMLFQMFGLRLLLVVIY
jgi:hypothetical protein